MHNYEYMSLVLKDRSISNNSQKNETNENENSGIVNDYDFENEGQTDAMFWYIFESTYIIYLDLKLHNFTAWKLQKSNDSAQTASSILC